MKTLTIILPDNIKSFDFDPSIKIHQVKQEVIQKIGEEIGNG